MRRRRQLAACLVAALVATVLADGGATPLTTLTAPATASAAADPTPWTQPSMPAKCTAAQASSGDVGTCLLDGPTGRPESRGWPTPPFPEPDTTVATTWTDLARGAAGSRVTALQQALVATGHPVVVDGSFGPATETAVIAFQVAENLPSTGVVDEATAGALGILDSAAVGVFPPTGWSWLGWAYNRSPALAGWEALFTSNKTAYGKVAVKQITSLPEALPLFEGFVRDIVAGGYKITDFGNYAFRCTSNSKKTCEGLTRDQLSNHAYGLAVDMNTTANPELTYRGVDGATACATPLTTDIPQWVVKTAEKWGLYWGGYGWGGGCASPSQQRTSVLRDVMHFEFRGTPAQAVAIATFNASGVRGGTPTTTCLSVADDAGIVTPRCVGVKEQPGAGWRTVIDTKAPAGATAAVVNITLTDPTVPGFVTAEPCTPVAGPRTSSNGNATPGVVTANLSIVPIDSSGRFCLFQSAPMDTVVDVQGFFAPTAVSAGGGSVLNVVAPQRLIDTRTDTFCAPGGVCGKRGPVAAGTEMAITTGVVPATATAMLANLTVTSPSTAGYVTADSCASLVAGPQTRSNANFVAGGTVANLAVVPTSAAAGGAQVCTYTSATAQKVVDVQGWFGPPATGGWSYDSVVPQRLLDTRSGAINAPGTIVRVQGPAGASAALVNLTLTDATAPGYITADKCSALVAGPQTKSNGNATVGRVSANVAVVPLDPDGSFCVFLQQPTHLVVDLQGTFSATGTLRFTPITPVRRHDSRELNA